LVAVGGGVDEEVLLPAPGNGAGTIDLLGW